MSDDNTSYPPSSPQTPSSHLPTRNSHASFRVPAPDPVQISSLAQKLHDALRGLRPGNSKNKHAVSLPVSELDDIIARTQQLVLLTSNYANRVNVSVADQLTKLSDAISQRLGNIESHLLLKSPSTSTSIPKTHPRIDGKRHDTLYLKDGNIVLIAGDVIFRAHQSILSLQSPVFSTMFTLPPTSAGNGGHECYDGAPLVVMPDEAESIEALLKVLYDPSQLPFKRLSPATPLTVRRVLTMATKYEMDALRNRIVSQLQADWPHTLREWDRLESEIEALVEEHESCDELMVDETHLDDRLPEPCAAIRLAMECRIPKILPAALYHLSRLDIDDDWFECRQNDAMDDGEPRRTARWDLLLGDDFRLLLKLRHLLSNYDYDEIYANYGAASSCRSPEACLDGWYKTRGHWESCTDPLKELQSFVQDRPSTLCKHCWSSAQNKAQDAREDLWKEICMFVEKHC
ncbi:BTB domain-containing protein [Mycena chlorophos]|uniref:BTB domain-containing protein n=1 Tax=Mycena chlorophos TaxID=658473 RepID=A0A8H6S2J3_MYCCL|nr:BTB domain-containing protein [Mycena chlorophos]